MRTAANLATSHRIDQLAAKINEMSAFDQAFFARHPGRRHRLRPSYPAEIEWKELVSGRPMTLDADCSRWLTIIRNCGRGVRSCLFMQDCALDGLADPGEKVVAALYKQLGGRL